MICEAGRSPWPTTPERVAPAERQRSLDQTRDFTYMGTVTRVLAEAALRGVDHAGPVNLAFGSRISLRELIGEREQVLGRALEVDHQQARLGDVRDTQADNALLLSLFPGVDAVPLRDGLAATVGWFQGRDWSTGIDDTADGH